ncbi:nucleotidyltransferase family protein [Marinobacteraceae bacterium S3BR75-40.1]
MANSQTEIPVIILAAGAGSRLGRACKPLLRMGDETLLEWAVRGARSVSRQVHVVVGSQSTLVRLRTRQKPNRWVFNPEWSQGMASSLQSGLRSLPSTAKGAVVMLVDQPRVPQAHLASLVQLANRNPKNAVATRVGRGPGAPAYLPRRLWREIMALEGDRGARAVLVRAHAACLDCPEAAWDVDTQEDWVRLRLFR